MMTMLNPNRTPATHGPIQWMPGYEVKARMKSEMGRMLVGQWGAKQEYIVGTYMAPSSIG